MAATSEFTASLGLQHSEIVQLMHPEDSGTTPDVPWIVVTLDAEKSQDRFSYQNLGSSNLPHWAWVPIGLFKEVLHIDGVNRVKTSMDKLSRTNSYVFGEPAPAEAMISDLVNTTRQSVLLDTTPTDFSDGALVFYQDGRNTFMGKVTNQADDTLVLQDYAPNDNLYTLAPAVEKTADLHLAPTVEKITSRRPTGETQGSSDWRPTAIDINQHTASLDYCAADKQGFSRGVHSIRPALAWH